MPDQTTDPTIPVTSVAAPVAPAVSVVTPLTPPPPVTLVVPAPPSGAPTHADHANAFMRFLHGLERGAIFTGRTIGTLATDPEVLALVSPKYRPYLLAVAGAEQVIEVMSVPASPAGTSVGAPASASL